MTSCILCVHVPHFALMFQWLYDSNFASDSHHPVGESKESCEEISASVEVCRSEGGGTTVERCDKTSRKPFPNSHKKLAPTSTVHCNLLLLPHQFPINLIPAQDIHGLKSCNSSIASDNRVSLEQGYVVFVSEFLLYSKAVKFSCLHPTRASRCSTSSILTTGRWKSGRISSASTWKRREHCDWDMRWETLHSLELNLFKDKNAFLLWQIL